MILQELFKYYERKKAGGEIAPPGMEYKEIPYLIVIDKKGEFVRFESTIYEEGNEKKARAFLLPAAVKRTSGVEANLLWDNLGYVLGIPNGEKESSASKSTQELQKRLEEQKKAFYSKVRKCFKETGLSALEAVINFENAKIKDLEKDNLWQEITTSKTGANLTFKLEGERDIICANPEIINYMSKNISDTQSAKVSAPCLVTGQIGEIAQLHPLIKGVRGARSTGANIVSFNQDAFVSFGKVQSFNAPVSKYAAFAYTTALNTLLAKGSHQKLPLGETTVVFWAEKEDPLEDDFANFFDFEEQGSESGENEKKANESLRRLLESPQKGSEAILENKTNFYVLGLAPNGPRIAIRFWHQATVGEIENNLRQYFTDLKIVSPKSESDVVPLNKLIKATAVLGKEENVHPLMASGLFEAALKNQPFPKIVLSSVVGRIRAEPDSSLDFDFCRAALLKAYINRLIRAKKYQAKLLEETMDEKNTNIAYRLGRLFATLEYLQGKAIGNPNASIRDRYYASAASRPAMVFPVLLNLAGHHISKIREEGGQWLDKQIQDILSVFPAENPFPRVLTLEEQGIFAVGYYQQKQWFFTKKEDR